MDGRAVRRTRLASRGVEAVSPNWTVFTVHNLGKSLEGTSPCATREEAVEADGLAE